MKKILIILTVTLFISMTAKGQNLFFIGEESYPCTESITLQSNSETVSDLIVIIAKDEAKGLFAVSTEAPAGAMFSGKLRTITVQ